MPSGASPQMRRRKSCLGIPPLQTGRIFRGNYSMLFLNYRFQNPAMIFSAQRSFSILCAVFLVQSAILATHADFFVALTGSDVNDGSDAKPFLTLERARDAIRQLKRAGTVPL